MRLVLTESIAAPLAVVFHAFTDLAGTADVVRSIQKIERIGSGPIGKGTRFRETRVVLGRVATEELEITDFVPKKTYTVEAVSQGVHYHTTYTFRSDGPRTVVVLHLDTQPVNWKAWLTMPFAWLFARPLRKMIAQDHADLAKVCEERARLAAAAAQEQPGQTGVAG